VAEPLLNLSDIGFMREGIGGGRRPHPRRTLNTPGHRVASRHLRTCCNNGMGFNPIQLTDQPTHDGTVIRIHRKAGPMPRVTVPLLDDLLPRDPMRLSTLGHAIPHCHDSIVVCHPDLPPSICVPVLYMYSMREQSCATTRMSLTVLRAYKLLGLPKSAPPARPQSGWPCSRPECQPWCLESV
jgi:hypothetical protein